MEVIYDIGERDEALYVLAYTVLQPDNGDFVLVRGLSSNRERDRIINALNRKSSQMRGSEPWKYEAKPAGDFMLIVRKVNRNNGNDKSA